MFGEEEQDYYEQDEADAFWYEDEEGNVINESYG